MKFVVVLVDKATGRLSDAHPDWRVADWLRRDVGPAQGKVVLASDPSAGDGGEDGGLLYYVGNAYLSTALSRAQGIIACEVRCVPSPPSACSSLGEFLRPSDGIVHVEDSGGDVASPPVTWVYIARVHPDAGVPADVPYLELVSELAARGRGAARSNRTAVPAVSVFGRQVRFSLADGRLPLLTTKRVGWRGVIEELLWFCRGETDTRVLRDRGVHIWDANSTREFLDARGLAHHEEGDIGPGYGFQWRHAGAEYRGPKPRVRYDGGDNGGFDQLAYVEHLLRTDPHSRRILMSAWSPSDLDSTALPPCHVMAQWYVRDDDDGARLSCMLTMRSCDTFLGLPFNVASYGALTHALAKRTGLVADELVVSIGDCHLYENCIEQALEQASRAPRPSPVLSMSDAVATAAWEELTADDFGVSGYYPHPAIRAEMAV
jgi:thymidylate synthase